MKLAVVLEEFQQHLSPEQEEQLKSIATHDTHDRTPDVTDVLQLTNEINEKSSARKSRILADRVQEFLNSVQQYCNIVDTCTGLNQIAALTWSCVKLAILVNTILKELIQPPCDTVVLCSVLRIVYKGLFSFFISVPYFRRSDGVKGTSCVYF